MDFNDSTLEKFKTFGALGYSVDKICNIMPEFPAEEIREALSDTTTEAYMYYQRGLNISMQTADTADFEVKRTQSESAKHERKRLEAYYNLKQELFNIPPKSE